MHFEYLLFHDHFQMCYSITKQVHVYNCATLCVHSTHGIGVSSPNHYVLLLPCRVILYMHGLSNQYDVS